MSELKNASSVCFQDATARINPIFYSLFAIIEWNESVRNLDEFGRFDLIPAIEVMGITHKTLNTGNIVYVRRNLRAVQAEIIVLSDDKKFLEKELRHLQGLSPEHLLKPFEQPKLTNKIKKQPTRKRRHPVQANGSTSTSAGTSSIDFHSVNSNAAWQHFHQVHQSQIVLQENSQEPQVTGPSDKFLPPSTQPHQNCESPKITDQKPIPPMTFDQQTQTDFRNNIQENSQLQVAALHNAQQQLLEEQRILRIDVSKNVKCQTETMEQVQGLKTILEDLTKKLDTFISGFEFTDGNNGSREIPVTSLPNSIVDSSFTLINNLLTSNSNIKSIASRKNNVQPEDYSNTNDSIISGRFSFNDNNISNSSSDPLAQTSTRRRSSNISSSNITELVKNDWNEDENRVLNFTICNLPNENNDNNVSMVQIGANKTNVPVDVFNAIEWGSYKAATRKLLITLFDRSVLATHSLTGRPSPAFFGRNKPMKNKLDPLIISDIIETVVKFSSVPENLIRTAITTKCADENKMDRQRKEKSLQQNKQNLSQEEAPPAVYQKTLMQVDQHFQQLEQNNSPVQHIFLTHPQKELNGDSGLLHGDNTIVVHLDNKENVILNENQS